MWSFERIYAYLNAGSSTEKYANRPPFPLLFDVELTNHCNFSCRMCETGMRTSSRPRGYMHVKHFDTILRAAQEHGVALRFIRWGEPTLHPRWLEWIGRAKQCGLPVHMNTNGFLLKTEHMQALVDMELDSIKFSFQGVDAASYEEMRGQAFFNPLMDKIAQFRCLRGHKTLPRIQISTTVTIESTESIAAFRKKALAVADFVNVGPTNMNLVPVEMLRQEQQALIRALKERAVPLQRLASCNEVFAKLSIDWNGAVTACCADNGCLLQVGHLDDSSLQDIWYGPALERIQTLLAKNAFDALPLCKACYESVPLV